MSDYPYLVQTRRVEDDHWLPIACVSFKSAESMLEFALTREGGYDQSRMLGRNPDGRTWHIITERSRF